MASYRKVSTLSPVDAAYIAGFIDGEGTISLARKHAGENRQLIISISNTEPRILKFVLAAVGAGKITRKKVAATHHTPSLTYAIWNRQALALLAQVQPHLRSYKNERAKLILSDYVRLTPRNGKYSVKAANEREKFERDLLSIRPISTGTGRWQKSLTDSDGKVRETNAIYVAFISPQSNRWNSLILPLCETPGVSPPAYSCAAP